LGLDQGHTCHLNFGKVVQAALLCLDVNVEEISFSVFEGFRNHHRAAALLAE
jgi:hypothetical protein